MHTLSVPRSPFGSSLEQVREDIQRLVSLGIEHVFFDLVTMPVNEQLRVLEKLRHAADIEAFSGCIPLMGKRRGTGTFLYRLIHH